MSPRHKEGFPVFAASVMARLDVGNREYGDESYTSPGIETIRELKAEAADLAGWGYILWEKLRDLEAKMVEIERMVDRRWDSATIGACQGEPRSDA